MFVVKWNADIATSSAGFSGVAVILLAALITAYAFQGPQGEAYSILTNNVSDLGKTHESELASLFNWSLKIGGVCLAGFMLGLGRRLPHPGGFLVAAGGIVAATSVTAVGIFPIQDWQHHKVAALTFFFSGFATLILFSLLLLSTRQNVFPRWIALPSSIAVLSFGCFLILPYHIYKDPIEAYVAGLSPTSHPFYWLPSFLEWMILFSVAAWVLTVSGYLAGRGRAGA